MIGDVQDDGGEILSLVVDPAFGPELDAQTGLLRPPRRGEHAAAKGRGDLDGGDADATRAAIHQEGLVLSERAVEEDIAPDRKEGLRQHRRLRPTQAFGRRQTVASRRDRIFGIAAATQKRTDPVPGRPARGIGPGRDDLACDLKARQVGFTGADGMAAIVELVNIMAIDARRPHSDQNLAGSRRRDRTRRLGEHEMAVCVVDLDSAHHGRRRGHQATFVTEDWSGRPRTQESAAAS